MCKSAWSTWRFNIGWQEASTPPVRVDNGVDNPIMDVEHIFCQTQWRPEGTPHHNRKLSFLFPFSLSLSLPPKNRRPSIRQRTRSSGRPKLTKPYSFNYIFLRCRLHVKSVKHMGLVSFGHWSVLFVWIRRDLFYWTLTVLSPSCNSQALLQLSSGVLFFSRTMTIRRHNYYVYSSSDKQ